MRRIISFTVAALVAALLSAGSAWAHPAEARFGNLQSTRHGHLHCDYRAYTVAGADRLIACFARTFHYPAGIPLCIGDRESGDDPTAASGANLGILQYHRSTFAQHWARVKGWAHLQPGARPGPMNPRSAVIAGVFWMARVGTYPWSTAPGCGG